MATKIAKIALKHGGLPLTGYVCRSWEKGRFNDPYLRDTLMDFGVVTDTLECTVNWSNMEQVHADVRKICHALPTRWSPPTCPTAIPRARTFTSSFPSTKMQD